MKKRILAVALVVAMVFGMSSVAFGKQNATNKKNQAQSNLNNVNAQISNIESQMSYVQSKINSANAELVSILADLEVIADDITQTEAELAQAQADLEAARIKEAEQYSSMKERIRYMYENGDTSLWQALLGSGSFTDVLNKLDNFAQVYDTDRTMLIDYENTRAMAEAYEKEVEETKSELEELQESKQDQEHEYERIIANLSSELGDYQSELSNAKALAAEYKATIAEQNRILAQIAASQNTVTGVTAGASTVGGGGSSSKPSSSGSSKPTYSGGASGSGQGAAVANYGLQFQGNPYVWGGTSLTNGADCSGFVMSVYAHYGVSLPHSSYDLRGVGYGVSASEMQAGDIVCYSGHVAICIGGGQIVHASNARDGIKVSNAYYRNIVCVRRIF